MDDAMRAISSNAGSGSVSRISYCRRVLSRSVSSCCTVAELESIGILCILTLRIINYPGAGRMRTENTPRIQQGGRAFAWGMSDTDWVHPNLRAALLYVGTR